jgi:hypothetical protein
MAIEGWSLAALVIVFLAALWVIWKTKTPGFGPYTTSVLVLTLVLFVAAVALLLKPADSEPLVNVLFAVAGFAGGLIAKGKLDA